MDVRTDTHRDISRLLHHGNPVGITNALDFTKRAFKGKFAAIDRLSMVFATQMEAEQAGAGFAASLHHVLGESKNPVDGADNREITDESALPLHSRDPAFP